MAVSSETLEQVRSVSDDGYKHGFVTDIEQESAPKGLNEDIIRFISAKKNEPEWLLDWRLKAYRHWLTMPEPKWAKVDFAPIDYQDAYYYSAPKTAEGQTEPAVNGPAKVALRAVGAVAPSNNSDPIGRLPSTARAPGKTISSQPRAEGIGAVIANSSLPNSTRRGEAQRIRDRVLTVLTSKTFGDMSNPLGKESLRHEIQTQLQPVIEQAQIQGVLFSEFVVQ